MRVCAHQLVPFPFIDVSTHTSDKSIRVIRFSPHFFDINRTFRTFRTFQRNMFKQTLRIIHVAEDTVLTH